MKFARRSALVSYPTALIAALSLSPWSVSADPPGVTLGEVGPWGQLETFPIVLEPSDTVLREPLYQLPLPTWSFPADWSVERIASLFRENGIAASEIETMLRPENRRLDGAFQFFFPSETAILSLDPRRRAALYAVLGQWSTNPYQSMPFSLGARNVTSLAALSPHPIPTEVLQLADRLVYLNEPKHVFADFGLVSLRLPDPAARLAFVKVLLRSPSLMVRLRVPLHADPEEVRRYWSLDGRYPGNLPFLEAAITDHDGEAGEPIDLVHLLPPLPRQLLYAYSPQSLAVGAQRPDCFWSALNFFEDEFSQRYLDPVVGESVGTAWLPVEGASRFGDLVVIHSIINDTAIHGCTYLADGLVFTKNGKSPVRPWLIQTLDEVKATYCRDDQHQVLSFRHRRFLSPEERETALDRLGNLTNRLSIPALPNPSPVDAP